jgi:glycosyltransferase involved in cell wall biosynthesis
VKDGLNGFLCDPLVPESICEAIESFLSLSANERERMGRAAREYAEVNLSMSRMISNFSALL